MYSWHSWHRTPTRHEEPLATDIFQGALGMSLANITTLGNIAYDGSVLPRLPASVLQLFVSCLYTMFAFVTMGLGAFAVSAQQKLDLDLPPNDFMQRLLWKHKALTLGMLGFIPATFSLVHLYTNSLHNFNLYSATNIVFAAVMSFGAKYLSEAMQQLVEESSHMDTLKAINETLFMCCKRAERLSTCCLVQGLYKTLHKQPWAKQQTTTSGYVKHNVFAAPALQDEATFWPGCGSPGMWLFSQGKAVRTYTGSTVVTHRIHQGLNTASFMAQDMWGHADGFVTVMAGRMAMVLLSLSTSDIKDCNIRCGTTLLQLGLLMECLLKVNYKRHALDIMCERYICRLTPSLQPGPNSLPAFSNCLSWMLGVNVATLQDAIKQDCCTAWLAYMNMVLLGMDLLRAHINQPVLTAQAKAHGTFEAGFFAGIMGLDGMAEAAAAVKAASIGLAVQAQAAAKEAQQSQAALQESLRRAALIDRYVQLTGKYQQAAGAYARAAQVAANTAAAASAVGNSGVAVAQARVAAAAASCADTAVNMAVRSAAKAVAARHHNVDAATERQIDQDEAAGVAALAAAAAPQWPPMAGVGGVPAAVPQAAAAAAQAAAYAADAAAAIGRATAAASEADAASVAAVLAVEDARRAHVEAAQHLKSAKSTDTHTAAAQAAADELVLAAAGSSADLLVAAAAAGDAKLAEAAVKAAADTTASNAAANDVAATVTNMSSPCISAVRYSDIYSLTDMELCGFAAALATLMVAVELPSLVGSEAAAASPAAASKVAAAFTRHLVAAHGGCPAFNVAECGFAWSPWPPDNAIPATQCRVDLVISHDSIPDALQGVECCPPAVTARNMQLCLAVVLGVVAAGTVLIATLVCRDGVMMAAAAGMWQSLCVAVLFGILHRVPGPMPWCQRSESERITLPQGEQHWDDVKNIPSHDPCLDRILAACRCGYWLDVFGEIMLVVVCVGFLATLILAGVSEEDCAAGVLVDLHSLNAVEWRTSIGVDGLHRMQP